MKNVYIVGGEGFALECSFYLQRMAALDKEIVFAGFLGEGGFVPRLGTMQHLFRGDCQDIKFSAEDFLIIGSGDVKIRARLFEWFDGKVPFFTLIDPSAIISPHSQIGMGNIFAPHSIVSPETKIGNANIFNSYSFVAHHVCVGNYNFVAPQVQLLGGCSVGHSNSIATAALLLPHAKIGNYNKIAPMAAVYKGCENDCCMLGNPARKMFL